MEDAILCPHCGCAVENSNISRKNESDEISVGLCILAFLIPLFGVIYWPVKSKETPIKAQACGITALISWALGFIFLLVV